MAHEGFVVIFAALVCVASAGLMGGWGDGDIHDKTVLSMADYAVADMNARSNSMWASKMVQLKKVQTQVVSGINYRLVFDMGSTNCRSGSTQDLSGCAVNQETVRECTVTVYDQPWTKTREVTHFACQEVEPPPQPPHEVDPTLPPKKRMAGGHKEVDVNDPELKKIVDFAVEQHNARTNSAYRYVLNKVHHATSQVVAGMKYVVTALVGETHCQNNDNNRHATLEQCPLQKGGKRSKCQWKVLYQAWKQQAYTLLEEHCQDKDRKHKPMDKTPEQNMLGSDGHDIGNYGQFKEFMRTYNKTYANKREQEMKFAVFRENMKIVAKLQATEKGTGIYGATQFADMTEAEFRKNYLTPKWDLTTDPSLKPAVIPTEPAPAAFDWRDHGAVTPVKNQGSCGSCWAFSTTGNIEGAWAVKKQKLVSLSEQELVDCDKLDDGCDGGLPTNAYKEIIRLGGLETEKQYPYEAEGEKCEFKPSDAKVYINGSLNISSNENDMAAWLAKNGPISIGINAMAMQFYFGGISHPWSFLCNPESLDHGVLIVGYGVKKGILGDTPFWIIKNSWGPSWGVQGYYLVYRGAGVCGLNKMPTSAEVL